MSEAASGNLKFDTITPYDIDTMELTEILKYVPEDFDKTLPGPAARLNLLKAFYTFLGYDLSPDGALAMVSEPKYQLILAPAGGGKTTQTQIKTTMKKALSLLTGGEQLFGQKILCLVYNKHNVIPMKATHARLVNKLKASPITGLEAMDNNIYATTLHAFCEQWKNEYATELGVVGHTLLKSDNASVEMMRSSFNFVAKFLKMDKVIPDANGLVRMYNYAKECMLEFDSQELRDHFPEIDYRDDLIVKTFNFYEKKKKNSRKYDYIDTLCWVRELMMTNDKARERIQGYFKYVVADEIQDFTPLMMDLLRLIVGDKPLTAIGDEDQCIYNFKGADVNNVLKFTELFPGGQVFVLNKNRRCGQVIVDAASYIIGKNKNRFNKKIIAHKPDGVIKLRGYNTEEGQLLNIVNRIEAMKDEERTQTVVCYRDKIYSTLLAEMLEERGIPFNTISGYKPFSHELFRHVKDVLDLLYDPSEPYSHIYLYKVLSANTNEIHEAIGYNAAEKKFNHDHIRLHFRAIDYGKLDTQKAFTQQMETLMELTKVVGTKPLKDYFPVVFNMICKNFWDYKKEIINNNLAFDNMFTERVFKFFDVDKTYEELFRELTTRENRIKLWDDAQSGVTLSTLHGLKGLEFKNVIMTYMDAGVFPNLDAGGRQMTERELEDLLESENRLAYVGITRAIDDLEMYYPIDNPSPYVKQVAAFLESQGKPSTIATPPKQTGKPTELGAFIPKLSSSSSNTDKGKSMEFGKNSFLNSALNRL